jgi:hypothetical protein
MNNQNRTADGRFATVKEAQRCDCVELLTYMFRQAKAAWNAGNHDLFRKYMAQRIAVRAAFFADYTEEV